MSDADLNLDALPLFDNELDVLNRLVPCAGQKVIELGCGSARLGRALVERFNGAQFTGLEVDAIQHAKNMAAPHERMRFLSAGAQTIPLPDASFDVALMLKSLHHVPIADMAQALAEVARVLRPGAWFYVSEPIYAGSLNDVVKLFNDEGVVRQAAQHALDAALRDTDHWAAVSEYRFATPVSYRHFAEFEQRMLRPTFADHHITPAILTAVEEALRPHWGSTGAHFTRPMHVRLFQRTNL